MTYQPTWWERSTNPDLVTRGLNVGSGPPTMPPDVNGQVPFTPAVSVPWLTQPAMRPTVTQRFLNFNVIANLTPVPLSVQRMEAIAVIFNVYSTGAASAFWGPNGVTPTTGIEIRPGLAATLALDQVREQWELQRALEHIGAMLAGGAGLGDQLGPFRAPRVILDLSTIFLTAAAAQAVSIIAFLPPELQ
jgi:hypothetical protein